MLVAEKILVPVGTTHERLMTNRVEGRRFRYLFNPALLGQGEQTCLFPAGTLSAGTMLFSFLPRPQNLWVGG